MQRNWRSQIRFGVVVVVTLLVIGCQPPIKSIPSAESTANMTTPAPDTMLEGQWHCIGIECEGKQLPRWYVEPSRMSLTVDGSKLVMPEVFLDGTTFSRPASPPDAMDISAKSEEDGTHYVLPASFSVQDDILRLSFDFSSAAPRPNTIATKPGDSYSIYSYAFPTDTKRVYLTGISMGAEGVWSLAAANPKRFAAIVPICGGGDRQLALALKDIPCWAFHGDADSIVPVTATRELIKAITKSGGRPQYQEYHGLDHNCWDRAYAEPLLYSWLQSQTLP